MLIKSITKKDLEFLLSYSNRSLEDFEDLSEKINLSFKNLSLLVNAFIHISFFNENMTFLKNLGMESNEKLEFLGDSILSFIVIKYLYFNFNHLKEGDLSQIKSFAVSQKSLATIAKELDLTNYIILGKGERLGKINYKNRILCDVFEALIGAYYIDSGIDCLEEWLNPHIIKQIDEMNAKNIQDHKTMLQICIQQKNKICPSYVLKNCQGPDHEKTFYVEVFIGEEPLATGCGKSKKKAEQNAAYYGLKKLQG